MKVTRLLPLVILATLLLVLSACAPAAAPSPTPTAAPKSATVASTPTAAPPKPTAAPPTAAPAAPTPKPVSLKFGSSGVLAYSGVYIAIEKGFFKEQGIDLESVIFQSGTQTVAPLGAGQLDVAGMSLSAGLFAAVDRGIDMKVVADASQDTPNWSTSWVVLRKDLADSGKVKSMTDLKGMKVAIPSPQGYGRMTIGLTLAEAGLKPEDVELVILPHADQAPALANKAIVAGFTVEPFIARGVQEGFSVKWIPAYKFFGGRAQSAFIVFGPQLAKNKELGQRFMTAYLKGVRTYLDAFEKKIGRDEVIRILAKQTDVKDPKLYDVMEMNYIEPNGVPDKKSMDAMYKWFVDSGEYKGKLTFADFTDLSMVDYAAQQLGKR